jgi:hypothetical protein
MGHRRIPWARQRCSAVSTARLIAFIDVLIVGSGTGAKNGE